MTGFEIFLCVMLGIVAFFVVVLSVPLHVIVTYSDKIYVTVQYLFVKIDLLPLISKPKKQKKQKQPEQPKEEKPKPEKAKKPGPSLLDMLKANGYDAMMELLTKLMSVLSRWGVNVIKSFHFDEIEIYCIVGRGDAAATAIEYGKACQKVYPLVAFLCSHTRVKRYDCSVEPDFLANHGEISFNFDFHLCLRRLINCTVAMAVRLVLGVVLKFLKGAKGAKKPAETPVPQAANE